jgi:hypothetical protein
MEMAEQRQLERTLNQLERQDILILDELGYVPFSRTAAELLFEVISRAYERLSLIVTTNLPFLELICNTEQAVDELIDVAAKAAIEAVLLLSAEPIPAYEAMVLNSTLGSRILDILMKGVSTRNYKSILPEMAETVGVSKSQVSREFVAASEQQLKALCERRFNEKEIPVVYNHSMRIHSQNLQSRRPTDWPNPFANHTFIP